MLIDVCTDLETQFHAFMREPRGNIEYPYHYV